MAFNPSPKVAAARDIGHKFNQDMVIIIMVNSFTGTIEYASYGENKILCDQAKKMADIAFEAIKTSFGE